MHRWWLISFSLKGLAGEIFGAVFWGAGLPCMLQNIHYPLASPPGFDQWHPPITATTKPLTDFPNTLWRQPCPCWKPLHWLCEKKSMCREEISYSWMLLLSSLFSFFLLNSLKLWKCSLQDETFIRESAWESLEIQTIFFSKQLKVCLLRLNQPKGQLYHDPWRESECLLSSTSAEWTGVLLSLPRLSAKALLLFCSFYNQPHVVGLCVSPGLAVRETDAAKAHRARCVDGFSQQSCFWSWPITQHGTY